MKKSYLIAGCFFICFVLLFFSGWIINDTSSNKEKVVQNVIENLEANKDDYLKSIDEINEIYTLYDNDTVLLYAPVKFDRLEVFTFDNTYGLLPDSVNGILFSKLFLKDRLNKTGTNTVKVNKQSITFVFYGNLYSHGHISLIYNKDNHYSNSKQLINNFHIKDSVNWLYIIDSVWAVSSNGYIK